MKKYSPSPASIFEKRTDSHRLPWLSYITGDFPSADKRITPAPDYRRETRDCVHSHLLDVIDTDSSVSVYDTAGGAYGGSRVQTMAMCPEEILIEESSRNCSIHLL